MSGYPQHPPSGYPSRGYASSASSQSGYPGNTSQGGYPGAPPSAGGGYPGAPPSSGGYLGAAPPSGMGGYPGSGGGMYPNVPQVDPNVAAWFRAVDQDRSGQISANELQKALVNGNWSHFSEEACRMMIDMYDSNMSGSIDVNEFQLLFDNINRWKAVFEQYDTDKSGSIEQNELQQAFTQMGYRFSPTFVQNLLVKFDPKTRKLTLDNFIIASVQIKRLTDGFRKRDREMRGAAQLQYEDFIGLAMGAHN